MITVIIPAYRAEESIGKAIGSCIKSNKIAQIVVVCDSCKLSYDEASILDYENLIVINNEKNMGAGFCRNLGLDQVSSEFTIFLDADDTIDPIELNLAYAELDQKLDMMITKYRYCRSTTNIEMYDVVESDNRIFNLLDVSHGGYVSKKQKSDVLQLVNFPWNKIYRTSFLRTNDIKFQDLPVHNDIYFHWNSIMKANEIVVHGAKLVNHYVLENRQQMTNTNGEVRLYVFQALEKVLATIRLEQEIDALPAFFCFTQNLLKWTRSRIDDSLYDAFYKRLSSLLNELTITEFNQVYKKYPTIACNMMILKKSPEQFMNPYFKL
jgi:glycosyltransferase involved in cell wall biosynthesis